MPSQSHRRENTGVLEDTRFLSDQTMHDTLSEGKRNHNNRGGGALINPREMLSA